MVCLFYTTVFLNFQFGFINYEVGDSKKLFFHVKEVQDGIELQAGDEVEFSVILNQRTGKCSACNVWRVWWVFCSLVTSFDCLLTLVISALLMFLHFPSLLFVIRFCHFLVISSLFKFYSLAFLALCFCFNNTISMRGANSLWRYFFIFFLFYVLFFFFSYPIPCFMCLQNWSFWLWT